jgi:hypothetical protein
MKAINAPAGLGHVRNQWRTYRALSSSTTAMTQASRAARDDFFNSLLGMT